MNVLKNAERNLRRNFALAGLVGAAMLSGCETSPSNRLETTANAISRTIWCETEHRWLQTKMGSQIETGFQVHDQASFYQLTALNRLNVSGKADPEGAQTVKVEKKTSSADKVIRFINIGTKNNPSWSVVANTSNQDPSFIASEAQAYTEQAVEIYESGRAPSQTCSPELSTNS